MEKYSAEIQRAILVNIDFDGIEIENNRDEFHELVVSAGLNPVHSIIVPKRSPDARFYIGKGKVAELYELVEMYVADVILFNQILSPAQERNLEKQIQRRVIDRIGLILDIFAQRARTYEGKLQVELAQLRHLLTRLIRGWTHLERQKGGIGLRGPGETQLETDRRLIGQRIKMINRRLSRVRKQRTQNRQKRKKHDVPVVSLVGYTNAGKSTLFNHLTGAGVAVADKLFATLDPTLRSIDTPGGRNFILTDTVGFIKQLPHDLVEAFKATLDEIREADLLIHVVAVAPDMREQRINEVNQVIELIGAENLPQIEVYNKIDLHEGMAPHRSAAGHYPHERIWISTLKQEGIDLLLDSIDRHLASKRELYCLTLPVTAGQLRARLFELGAVRNENIDSQGSWVMEVELEQFRLNQLCSESKFDLSVMQTNSMHR